jgi:NAD dependent epimerase/dehydratase family enzyme
MIAFAIENEEVKGIYNAVSPHPVSNSQFNRLLAQHLYGDAYISLSVPGWVLKLVLGEMSIEVLKSATVAPLKIRQAGFHFNYASLPEALKQILTVNKNKR